MLRVGVKFAGVVLSLLCAFSVQAAPAPSYNLVKEKSFIKFVAAQNGKPVEGTFKEFSADIIFDNKAPEKSQISVQVDTGSVQVSDRQIHDNITLPEWLSSAAFPKASFTCKKLTQIPDSNGYYGDGELTIRGVKKPVVVNFQLTKFDEKIAVANGYITIKRSDYGVGQGQWASDETVKNEVRVEFRMFTQRQ